MNNYHPVSLTSLYCKVTERLIAIHITIFLEPNYFSFNQLNRFRNALTAVNQLIETALIFILRSSRKMYVICVDSAKAFEKLPHKKVLLNVSN